MTDRGLRPRRFDRLPATAIEPTGWLRRQLEIQAQNVTGHLDEVWDSLADNQWLGGAHDGWERGPYYVDGLVPLAQLLDDDELGEKADTWIEAFLDWQAADGWIGPREPNYGFADSVWAQAIILKIFREHYAGTGDERVLEAGLELCDLLYSSELDATPLEGWSEFRAPELRLGIQWLFEQTGEPWLLDLSEVVHDQGYDWHSHFAGGRRTYGFEYDEPAPEWTYEAHVVNNAMGLKAPALSYRETGETVDRDAVATAIDTLSLYHGQATGLFSGDECLAGRKPTRGTELCAVVEYMYSLEEAVSILGDVRFADRLERIGYNALPAQFTEDMWAHQYVQLANQVTCAIDEYPWTNSPEATCFGLEPHYGCCTANLHQGWPKLVSHAWMATDDGLAAVVHGPSTVRTTIDGVEVSVHAETAYPFEDEIHYTVEPTEATAFTLELRIPEWATEATIEGPDGGTVRPDAGTFHAIEREWSDGDAVRLAFDPALEVDRRYQGSATLWRGPLVFSLPVESEERRYPGEPDVPYAHREYHPTEPWNYGLAIDPDDPEYELSTTEPGATPFSEDRPPVQLGVDAATVQNWTLDGAVAGDVPASPTTAGDPGRVTLQPYGCTTLRVTEFPLIE